VLNIDPEAFAIDWPVEQCSYNCGRARGSALKDRSTLRNIKLLV
jgi:hypothetical protein